MIMRRNTFNKIISVLIVTLVLFITVSSFTVFSLQVELPKDESVGNDAIDENLVKGVCGTQMNLSWIYNKSTNVLTITGVGAMKDRAYGASVPWKDYASSVKTVVVESGVTKIGSYAFYSCDSLQKVVFCGTEEQWSSVIKGNEWKRSTVTDVRIHNYADGVCSECGFECVHESADDGYCTECGVKVSFVILGDVDGDGDITNADVLEIYRYIYDHDRYPIDVEAGDVDGDGDVTNSDVLSIYRYIYDPVLYPLGVA